jgi:Fe-Mn family superoxide dismutase
MAQTKLSVPPLPYAYDALEPVLGRELMELHHSGHHKAYVDNLNAALEKYDDAEKKKDWQTMSSLIPVIKFNMGGHVNHTFFWKILAPKGSGGIPEGELAETLLRQWGSVDRFKQEFNKQAATVQGSGWCWLGYCSSSQTLVIVTTQNQDPCITTGYFPVLGIDVWEHAFYLTYRNKRQKYLEAIWDVINWNTVKQNYLEAKQTREA